MRVRVEPVRLLRPGKAQVFLRPEANRLLEAAIKLYGQPIYPTGAGSAGRTYEQQLHYWNIYQAGGPVASHPDYGPNPHRRYGALDISDPEARWAMLRAGWKATTPSEWWHFEHPDCRTWPIVTSPYVARTTTRRRSPVDAYCIARMDGAKVAEISLCHPSIIGPTDLERGYIVIRPSKNPDGTPIPLEDAMVAAARAYGLGLSQAGVNGGTRNEYMAGQQLARDLRTQYLRDRAEVSSGGGSSQAVLEAIAALPTAAQNGQAAREAIVK
jgi:hypothetical protein